MKISTATLCAVLCALMFASNASAALVTLIDEDFASGSSSGATFTSSASGVSNGQQWTWTGQSGETGITAEQWTGTGGASARGLSTTYDDDQNGGTPQVNIPGGLEVMSSYTSDGLPDTLRVAVNVVLPANLDDLVDGTLTFFIANRIAASSGGQGPQVSVFNLTDNSSILAPTSLVPFSAGNPNWTFKSQSLNFLPGDAGDTIQVWFQESITSGSSPGARGLEVADVTLVVTVPEPASALPLLLAGVGLLARRRRLWA